jgi:hypothetical protein
MSEAPKSPNVVEPPLTMGQVLNKAGGSALRGGLAGAAAMGANVLALMWMRTTVRVYYMIII